MRTETVTLPGADGAPRAARIDRPDGPVRATAIVAHCLAAEADCAAVLRISARLAALGIAVLRLGAAGDAAGPDDLVAAAAWMAGQGLSPQLLIGHSLGGVAALVAAARIDGLRAVVTIGAPADPARHPAGTIAPGLTAAALADALPRLRAALLVLHAPRDMEVGIDNAQALFVAARHPKSFVSLDDADHRLTREADALYVAGLIAAWAARYLDLPAEAAPAEAPEGVVRVSEVAADGFLQDVVIGRRHHLLADEPESAGGTDLGPSPYQLLSAALGACTSMTIRIYARRKGMPLTHVACDVTHDRRHISDCEDCDKPQPKADVFTRTIHLHGDLSAEQRASLLAIADRCPVHKTLHGQAIIESALAEDI